VLGDVSEPAPWFWCSRVEPELPLPVVEPELPVPMLDPEPSVPADPLLLAAKAAGATESARMDAAVRRKRFIKNPPCCKAMAFLRTPLGG
jgi:hypothetical protein